MISPRRQLMGLLSSVSDCRTLLHSSVRSSNRDDGSCCNCWLTEPGCALVRAQKLSRLTDMQLEALAAIQNFCLLCRRHQTHNASNAAAPVMTASTTVRDCGRLHGNHHQRPSHHRLGAFRSAIISQLWEIHRLLLALIDVDKAQEVQPAKLHHKSMSGSRPRSLSVIEMQLDTTSSEVRCCGDNRRTGFGEQRFLTIPLHQECHNLQTPSSCSPTTFEAKPHLKLHAASVRSNSVSEWSFACAAAADKQVFFASTVCVGKAGTAPKAAATKTSGKTRRPATGVRSKNYRAVRATNDKQPLTGIDVMLWRKNYQQFVDINTSSKSSPFSSSSNDNSTTINSAVPELSSNSDRQYRACKIREDIVFQRVLCTEAQSQAVQVGSSNAALVATLSGLKCRIDAIRQNLSERDGGCRGFSVDSSAVDVGRKSRSCRPDRSRRPISQPATEKSAGGRGPLRNQSNLSWKAGGAQQSERQLRCISARLDRTVTQLTRMLRSAMWLCGKRKSNLKR